jgi:hypothetical protein
MIGMGNIAGYLTYVREGSVAVLPAYIISGYLDLATIFNPLPQIKALIVIALCFMIVGCAVTCISIRESVAPRM